MEDEREGIEKILIDSYPKFLSALRDTYPLAFLGSFSIVIASFLQNAPKAQEYAIAAAVIFLLAFLCSLILKFTPAASSIALMLYILFGGGIVLLMAVTNELSKACSLTPVVFRSTMGLFVSGIVLIMFWNWISSLREERFKRLQERSRYPDMLVVALLIGSLGILSILIHLVLYVYSAVSNVEIPGVLQDLTAFGILLFVISVIAIIVMARFRRR